jgi:Ni/Co efflux regulator RcnB
MKKMMTALAFSLTAMLVTSNIAHAAPYPDNSRDYDNRGDRGRGHDRGNRDFQGDDMQDRRKMREERGVKRLQQHKWQTGYIMPQHYRGNAYKADYKQNNLPKPANNQQWYKINNDYILVDSNSNNIVQIREE